MNSIKLYLKYISISIRSQMAYKASFIMMSFGHFFITVIEFLGIAALFQRFGTIQGWNLYEVALFYGVINVAFALTEAFGRGYDVFARLILTGDFDRMLLRPRSFFLQIIGSDIQLMRIGRLSQGLFVLVWALIKLEVVFSMTDVILMLVAIFGSAGLFMGLFIIQATLSFWSIQGLEIINSFTYGGVQTAQYPMSIYKKWFQKIFIFIIPIGSTAFFPLLVVLDKWEGYIHNPWLAGLAPLLGIIFFVATLILFRVGVKYYKSTGS